MAWRTQLNILICVGISPMCRRAAGKGSKSTWASSKATHAPMLCPKTVYGTSLQTLQAQHGSGCGWARGENPRNYKEEYGHSRGKQEVSSSYVLQQKWRQCQHHAVHQSLHASLARLPHAHTAAR